MTPDNIERIRAKRDGGTSDFAADVHALLAEIAALTRERDELREAVGVLGREARSQRCIDGYSAIEINDAKDAVNANPIASAAVRGEEENA